MKRRKRFGVVIDLYFLRDEPPAQAILVARRPSPTAKVIGSAGQVLVRPNFGCLIDAAFDRTPGHLSTLFLSLAAINQLLFRIHTSVVAFLQ